MPHRSVATSPTRSPLLDALLAGALLAGTLSQGACRSADASSELESLLRHGRFEEALELAEEGVAAAPDDPAAREDLVHALVALTLERGRRLTFDDRDEEALAEFYTAWQVDPENAAAVQWIDKTRRKLAERLLDEGTEAEAAGDLDTAEASYQAAVDNVPDHERAVQGLARVLIKQNERLRKGDQYYKAGVRSRHDLRLHEALRDFTVTHVVFTPENTRAERKASETQVEIARERLYIAQALREDDEHLHAAWNEFRLALLLDPDLVEAEEAIAELEPEIEAVENLSKIEMLRWRGQYDESHFDEAEELARASLDLTVRYHEAFQELLNEIVQARLLAKYEDAITLEEDFDYEHAVELYSELVDEQGYYQDVLTRRDTLLSYIEMAADLYGRAGETQDPEERRALLRQIQLFWPTYSDVEDQLAELGE